MNSIGWRGAAIFVVAGLQAVDATALGSVVFEDEQSSCPAEFGSPDSCFRFEDAQPQEIRWIGSAPVELNGAAAVELSFNIWREGPSAAFVVGLAFLDEGHAWLAGQNLDVEGWAGGAEWEPYRVTWRRLPKEARYVRVVVGPAPEHASHAGTVFLRGLSLYAVPMEPASQGVRLPSVESLPSVENGPASEVLWLDWPEQTLAPAALPPTQVFDPATSVRPGAFSLLRGERDAVQLGIRSTRTLTGVRVGSDPKQGVDVSFRSVVVLPASEPSDPSALGGERPDALEPLVLPWVGVSNRTRALWIDIAVSRTAAPGARQLDLELEFDSGQAHRIPFVVNVADVDLPLAPALPFVVGLSSKKIARFHGAEGDIAAKQKLFAAYMQELAASRLGAIDVAEVAPLAATWPEWGWQGGRLVRENEGRLLALGPEHSVARTVVPIEAHPHESLMFRCRSRAGGYQAPPLPRGASSPDSLVAVIQWRTHTGAPNGEQSFALPTSSDWQSSAFSLPLPPPGTAGLAILLELAQGAAWIDDVSVAPASAFSGGALIDPSAERVTNGGFERDAVGTALHLHTEDFDKWAAYALDDLQMPWLHVAVPGAPHGHEGQYVPGTLAGHAEGSLEYDMLLSQVGQAARSHLAQRDWLERSFAYPFDEPSSAMLVQVGEALEVLGASLKGVRRLLTHPPAAPLEGHVDIWMPVWSDLRAPNVDGRPEKGGDALGSYVSCCLPPWVPNLYLDREPAQARSLPLLAHAQRLDALLYWSAVHWDSAHTGPPQQDPYTKAGTWLASGEWVGNGDGRLFYPPRAPDNPHAPVPTQRLRLLAASQQDIDRLALVEGLAGEAGWEQLAQGPHHRGIPHRVAQAPGVPLRDFAELHRWRAGVWYWLNSHAQKLPRVVAPAPSSPPEPKPGAAESNSGAAPPSTAAGSAGRGEVRSVASGWGCQLNAGALRGAKAPAARGTAILLIMIGAAMVFMRRFN